MNFDPRLVLMKYGPVVLDGFADGTAINVEYQGDGATAAVGFKGNAVLVQNPNKSAEITVRLYVAEAVGRNVARALVLLHEALNLPQPLTIVSLSTGEKLSGIGVIKNLPNVDFAQGEPPVREFMFVVGSLESLPAPAVTP